MKRIFDIAVSALLLILAAPLLLFLGAAIKLDSPGPVFFRQTRIGRGGIPFTCIKLRTMHQDTGDRPSHEVPAEAVTIIGRLLRRTKLDEIPQLWNVLIGEMSLVGPRPCLPTQTDLIAARKRRGVLDLRPGITGVSQVDGIDMSDAEKLAESDASYSGASLLADLRLLAATFVGAGRGDRVRFPGRM